MINNWVIAVLRTFSEDQLKEFSKFLNSPYFNSNKRLPDFFKKISKFHPKYDDKELTKEYLMLSSEELSSSRYGDLFPELYKLSLEFINQEWYKQIYNEKQLNLVSELFNRKLFDIYKEQAEILEKNIEKDYFYVTYFWVKFQLEHRKYELDTYKEQGVIKGKKYHESQAMRIWSLHEDMFYFYFLNSLVMYAIANYNAEKLSEDVNTTIIGQFFQTFFPVEKVDDFLINRFPYRNEEIRGIIKLHWLYYKIQKGIKVEENFKEYKILLHKHESKLHKDHLYTLYQIGVKLQPYSIKHPEFEKTEFEFYNKLFVKEKYVSHISKFMLLRSYKFYWHRGLETRRLEWIKKLTTTYIKALSPELRDGIKQLTSAYFNIFVYKKLEEAIDILKKLKHNDDRSNKLDRNVLLLVAYYENNNEEEVFKAYDNLRNFIKYKETPILERKRYSQFLKTVRTLIDNKINKKEKNLERLKKNIRDEVYLPYRNWILEKINETKNL